MNQYDSDLLRRLLEEEQTTQPSGTVRHTATHETQAPQPVTAAQPGEWATAAAYVQQPRRSLSARWLGFPVALILGVTLGWFGRPLPSLGAVDAAREQYYRGVYDVCRSVLRYSDAMCQDALRSTIEHHWYEDPTPGWSWPLPEIDFLPQEQELPDASTVQL